MKIEKLCTMTKGWFVGNFIPATIQTADFEVGVKYYNSGDVEPKHVHKLATEITCLVYGKVLMNGVEVNAGDIVTLLPGEITDFAVIEPSCTVVVKTPSVLDDKYLA